MWMKIAIFSKYAFVWNSQLKVAAKFARIKALIWYMYNILWLHNTTMLFFSSTSLRPKVRKYLAWQKEKNFGLVVRGQLGDGVPGAGQTGQPSPTPTGVVVNLTTGGTLNTLSIQFHCRAISGTTTRMMGLAKKRPLYVNAETSYSLCLCAGTSYSLCIWAGTS